MIQHEEPRKFGYLTLFNIILLAAKTESYYLGRCLPSELDKTGIGLVDGSSPNFKRKPNGTVDTYLNITQPYATTKTVDSKSGCFGTGTLFGVKI